MTCEYVDHSSGGKCVNTKEGHAKGHQDASGQLLADGAFVESDLSPEAFLTSVEKAVESCLQDINENTEPSREARLRYAADLHRQALKKVKSPDNWGLNSVPFWWFLVPNGLLSQNAFRSSVCYVCLFGKPEYRLPCRHVIYMDCVSDFDQSELGVAYPGRATHNECLLCSSCDGESWPYNVAVRPRIGGLRVLSLDGGGVRGIVELAVLQRLEAATGLGLPLGEYFDLIVGTSAGSYLHLIVSVALPRYHGNSGILIVLDRGDDCAGSWSPQAQRIHGHG